MSVLDPFISPFVDAVKGRVRLGWNEAKATLCTHGHGPMYLFAGQDFSGPTQRPHLDVEIEVWNRGHEKISLLKELASAEVAGQKLQAGDWFESATFPGAELEVGGRPEFLSFRLRPALEEDLRADVGDEVRLHVRPTRGRARVIKVSVTGGG